MNHGIYGIGNDATRRAVNAAGERVSLNDLANKVDILPNRSHGI